MQQWVQVVACSFIACKLNKNICLLSFFLCTLDVDFEKDIVLCEVPFGGILFINNLVPHRRFVFFISIQSTYVSHGLGESLLISIF